jgi:hypothetical protein
MKTGLPLLVLAFAWLLASCAPGATYGSGTMATVMPDTAIPGGGTEAPAPSLQPPTAIPALGSGASPTDLKYRLLEQYPDFFFCDPDSYPVARGDETQQALEKFAELQANTEEFQSILAHNGMSGVTSFADEQKLQIYGDHKKLAAILFEVSGDKYQFQLRTADQQQGFAIKGLIDAAGNITVQEKSPTMATCPICLASWTTIDTPDGGVRVADLQAGDLVWTLNGAGQRVAAPVLLVTSVQVPTGHEMAHLKLSDGREAWASPGHPTVDGRTLGALRIGDTLDGGLVTLAERAPYGQPATYDLLPAGATGWYWADGILLGSTLSGR